MTVQLTAVPSRAASRRQHCELKAHLTAVRQTTLCKLQLNCSKCGVVTVITWGKVVVNVGKCDRGFCWGEVSVPCRYMAFENIGAVLFTHILGRLTGLM